MTTQTNKTPKTSKPRKLSKKQARIQLEAARLRQRIERENNIDRWAGKAW